MTAVLFLVLALVGVNGLVVEPTNELRSGDSFRCSRCSNLLAARDSLVDVVSSEALGASNVTLWSGRPPVLVQRFSNGAREFELVTVLRTAAVAVTLPSSANTWWPGFSWRIATCPRCHTHVGWLFEPTAAASQWTFAALDLAALDLVDELLQN